MAVGPIDQAATFFDRLSSLSPDLGLSLSLPKSSLLWPSSESPPGPICSWATTHSIPLLLGAAPLLGSIVGFDTARRQRFAAERVRSHEPFFQALRHPLLSTQAAFLLLRVCALPRLLFTFRTLPHQLALRTAATILRLDPLSIPREVRVQMSLPLRLGGMGLRSMVATAPAAFLGSLAAAAPYLLSPHLQASTPLFADLEYALSLVRELPGLSLPPATAFLPLAAQNPPRALQRAISHAGSTSLLRSLLQSSPSLLPHLLSLQQPGASAWLSAVPTRPELVLPDDDFRLAARLRLQLFPASPPISTCRCGPNLPLNHSLTCYRLKRLSVTTRHGTLLYLLVTFLRDAGLQPVPEARSEDGKRPDLRLSLDGHQFLLDISITHPTSPSALKLRLSSRPLGAAKAREYNKIHKYGALAAEEGASIIPLVMEKASRNSFVVYLPVFATVS